MAVRWNDGDTSTCRFIIDSGTPRELVYSRNFGFVSKGVKQLKNAA